MFQAGQERVQVSIDALQATFKANGAALEVIGMDDDIGRVRVLIAGNTCLECIRRALRSAPLSRQRSEEIGLIGAVS